MIIRQRHDTACPRYLPRSHGAVGDRNHFEWILHRHPGDSCIILQYDFFHFQPSMGKCTLSCETNLKKKRITYHVRRTNIANMLIVACPPLRVDCCMPGVTSWSLHARRYELIVACPALRVDRCMPGVTSWSLHARRYELIVACPALRVDRCMPGVTSWSLHARRYELIVACPAVTSWSLYARRYELIVACPPLRVDRCMPGVTSWSLHARRYELHYSYTIEYRNNVALHYRYFSIKLSYHILSR